MSLRLRSVATSLRTRLAAALALAMLGPIAVVVIVAGTVIPEHARAAARDSAARDASSAALALVTQCEAIRAGALALARQAAQFGDTYPHLTVQVAQPMADQAAAQLPGVTAAVFDPAGQVLAVAGDDPVGRLAVTSAGSGSSCHQGPPGGHRYLAALAQVVPVKTRRDGVAVPFGSVVLWQSVDEGMLRQRARAIGSSGSLRVLTAGPVRAARYVSGDRAYASLPPRAGMPFGLQAIQPVRGAGAGPWLLGVLVVAGLAIVLLTRVIAGRLTQPLAAEVATTMEMHEEARRLSITDALTGVGNLRHLSATLSHEVERATRFDRPFSVLMLDLDHFKDVNDTLGHEFGDTVLREFALRLRRCLRELDTVARYGGEEFVLVLPETGLEGGCSAAERVVDAVHSEPFGLGDVQRSVTVSVGVASFPVHARTAAELLRCADQALYAAKSAGRNRWAVAPAPAAPADSVPQAG